MSPPKPASPRMLSVIGVGSMESDGPSSRPTTTVATSPAPNFLPYVSIHDHATCWNKFKACDFPPPLMEFSPAIPFKIEFSPHQPSTAKPPHLTLRLVLGIRTAAARGTVVALLYDCPIYSSPSLRTILRGGILHHPSRARDRVSRTASHYIASSASACVSQSLIRSFARKERHSATGQANIRTVPMMDGP
ncbi:hypothetical protein CPAR01_04010 [Colletotrichum paranaense]|uniref:Uncharacterized protein n=1 Tax=Colletotrichum paranaense TaxID=1914294 RepID=A0ABQ9SV49_9PEZI|nr:uncharacterized protein CPAR01_04010 [Colletotrichum paranaense]KAK1543377.1 hypothetical protein CPAR01_04010 [Colletotrichum paranaense]